MRRGVSSGGGESSLSYLFGSGEPPKPAAAAAAAPPASSAAAAEGQRVKDIPAGIQGAAGNNYFRADGQNTGNFITDRPSTKVHDAPGGRSSLGYLFGDGGKK